MYKTLRRFLDSGFLDFLTLDTLTLDFFFFLKLHNSFCSHVNYTPFYLATTNIYCTNFLYL